jgi:hypothetical protein
MFLRKDRKSNHTHSVEKYNYLFEDKKQLKEAYERFITMFKSKYAHDFYFIKKQETVNKLDETKKAL